MEIGQQVIYVPDHIKDPFNFGYPNGAQPGFITSFHPNGGDCFVRYWLIENGAPTFELRTKANSELTPCSNLRQIITVPQEWVEFMMDRNRSE